MSDGKPSLSARAILRAACFTFFAALCCAPTLRAQTSEGVTPGAYLLIRALSGEGPVIPNALVLPSPISVERISVTKDSAGRLVVTSEEAPEFSGEIHQVENFLQFTLIRRQPRQKLIQEVSYLCTAKSNPDGTLSGAFSSLGRAGGIADGLGGGFKREGSFVLYPQRSK